MARPPITKARPWTPTRGQFAGRTFSTEREYRNALARLKGFPSWHHQQRASAKSVGPKSYERLRASQRQARAAAMATKARMEREGISLTRAAKIEGTTPNTVLKWAGPALERTPGGRYRPKSSDRLYRRMVAVTTEGVQEVPVRSSRQGKFVSEHHTAVKLFLKRGDEAVLRPFRNKTVGGKQLEVDPSALEELERRGEFDYESIYED